MLSAGVRGPDWPISHNDESQSSFFCFSGCFTISNQWFAGGQSWWFVAAAHKVVPHTQLSWCTSERLDIVVIVCKPTDTTIINYYYYGFTIMVVTMGL